MSNSCSAKYTSKGKVSDPIRRLEDHPAFPFVSSDDVFVGEFKAHPAYALASRANMRSVEVIGTCSTTPPFSSLGKELVASVDESDKDRGKEEDVAQQEEKEAAVGGGEGRSMPARIHHHLVRAVRIGFTQRRRLLSRSRMFAALVKRLMRIQIDCADTRMLRLARRALLQCHFVGLKNQTPELLFQDGQRLHDEKRFCDAARSWGIAALLNHGASHAMLASVLLDQRGDVFKLVHHTAQGQRSSHVFDCAFHLAYLGERLGCVHSKGVLGRCYMERNDWYNDNGVDDGDDDEPCEHFFCPRGCYWEGDELSRESAAAGSCFGQYALGSIQRGHGNYADCVRLYRLAADDGHAHAHHELATLLHTGKAGPLGVNKDATEAARYFRAAADKGYHSAVFMIGLMTEEGVGVPQDYTEAAKLYRSIADTHCQAVCFRLGRMFELGLGVALDTMEAMRLYDIAANVTVSNATFVEKYSDWKQMSCQALSTLLRAAADQGNAHAQYKLGCMFEKGLYMEPPGAQQVVTMLSMFACVQKDRNRKEAFRYFRLAADQGNKDAQFRAGECLDNGEGVAKDCAEALRYYRLSGNQGHVGALCAQGRLLEQGDIGVSQDYAEAARAYSLAAEAGDEESMCALGEILEKGLGGVKQDRNEAIRLYKMCKGEFEYFAMKALGQLCPSSDEAGNHENSSPSL